jgi:hypothetical protein
MQSVIEPCETLLYKLRNSFPISSLKWFFETPKYSLLSFHLPVVLYSTLLLRIYTIVHIHIVSFQ